MPSSLASKPHTPSQAEALARFWLTQFRALEEGDWHPIAAIFSSSQALWSIKLRSGTEIYRVVLDGRNGQLTYLEKL